MALQTFTAGQVLTAAQVNALQANDYNQTVSTKTGDYVLVAADKGTRVVMNSASAQTITVNTSLFSAGDTLFIQNIGAGICTITAGTATVSTAGSLALPQNAGGTLYFTSAGVSIFFPTVSSAGALGLTFIKSQVIGTTVASVNVTGAFSATYDAYKIIVTGGISSATVNLGVSLGATATGYYAGYVDVGYASSTVGGFGNNNTASWTVVGYGTATSVLNLNVDIQNPFSAKNTTFQTFTAMSTTGAGSRYGAGYLANTTSYTDFTITPSSGTLTGGTVRVYGYNN
jgi:hypothetical protein